MVRKKKPKKRKHKKVKRKAVKKKAGTITDMINLIPSTGSVKLNSAAKELHVDEKVAGQWAKELKREGLVGVKRKYFLFGEITLFPTKMLQNKREDEEIKKYITSEKKRYTKKIITPADELLSLVGRTGQVSVGEASKLLNVDRGMVEEWARAMRGLVQLEYPANFLASPVIRKGEVKPKKRSRPVIRGKVLDSYGIVADKVPADVKLFSQEKESMPLYHVELSEVGDATRAILNSVIEDMTDRIEIEVEDISDPKRMEKLKGRFFSEAKALVGERIPVSPEDADILAGIVLHDAYGLGNLELLMSDDWLEEVCVNTSHVPLTAYHKKHGWMKTDLSLDSEKAIYNYAAQIGRKVERSITSLDPIMDAHLLTGDRVNATLFPISSFGNTITIRKFARRPWTITQFISPEHQTLSTEIAAFLWLVPPSPQLSSSSAFLLY